MRRFRLASPPGGRDKARPPGIPPAGRTIRPGRSAFPQRGEHFRRDTLYILFRMSFPYEWRRRALKEE